MTCWQLLVWLFFYLLTLKEYFDTQLVVDISHDASQFYCLVYTDSQPHLFPVLDLKGEINRFLFTGLSHGPCVTRRKCRRLIQEIIVNAAYFTASSSNLITESLLSSFRPPLTAALTAAGKNPHFAPSQSEVDLRRGGAHVNFQCEACLLGHNVTILCDYYVCI